MRPETFSGRRASQMSAELEPFLELLRYEGVRSYLEIGARHGDTFHAVMSSLPPGSRGVAVDLPGGAWGARSSLASLQEAARDLDSLGYVVEVILGDSRRPEIVAQAARSAPFDAALIDGDHRYEGVAADWRNYGPMAGIVAFHDIVGDGQRTRDGRYAVEVPRLWAEIAPAHHHVAFVAPGSAMGIGVIFR